MRDSERHESQERYGYETGPRNMQRRKALGGCETLKKHVAGDGDPVLVAFACGSAEGNRSLREAVRRFIRAIL